MISNLIAVHGHSVAPEAARNEAARNVVASGDDQAADDAFAMLVGPQADDEQTAGRQSGKDQPDQMNRVVQDPVDGSAHAPLGIGQAASDRASATQKIATPSGVIPEDQSVAQSRRLPEVSAGRTDLNGRPTAPGQAASSQGPFAEHIADKPRSSPAVNDAPPRQGAAVGSAPGTASEQPASGLEISRAKAAQQATARSPRFTGDVPGQTPAALPAAANAAAGAKVPSNAEQAAGPDGQPIPEIPHGTQMSAPSNLGFPAGEAGGQSRSIFGLADASAMRLHEDRFAPSAQDQAARSWAKTKVATQPKASSQPPIMAAHPNTNLGSVLPLGEAATMMMEDPATPTETDADPTISGSSAASAVAASSPAHVALPRAMAPPVASQIAQAAASGSGEGTQITLNPEELGRVRISMSSGESGLVVTILAERPETADLMRRNIDLLLREFAELGYHSPAFEFQNGDADSNRDSPAQNRAIEPVVNEMNDASSTSTSPAARTPSGGLDLIL